MACDREGRLGVCCQLGMCDGRVTIIGVTLKDAAEGQPSQGAELWAVHLLLALGAVRGVR